MMGADDRYGGRSGKSAPDPTCARTVDEFIACLRRLKVWAGDPSLEVLRRRSGVPSSTLADAVRVGRKRLPRLDLVRSFVQACGVPVGDVDRWEAGWRRLREDLDAASRPAVGSPHQLPRLGSELVGRQEVLDRLDALHRQGGARRPRGLLALIVGCAGTGKTAVALHWAHEVTPAYPDGQLYLDLQGISARAPVSAGDALATLLAALGVPAAGIPPGVDARAGLFRSLTYPRRLLLVLDNARDAEHVRPLLPGGPACTTLVTSRNRLSALVAGEGGMQATLASLHPDDAVELLHLALADARPQRERADLGDLARLCGYLPLALRIVATNLTDNPQWTVAGYTVRLAAGDRLRLLALNHDESTAVRTAFDSSYAALAPSTRAVFRRLACTPRPQFTIDEVTALVRRPPADTMRRLERLATAHLVEPVGPGRFTMHDLVRLYAESLAGEEACDCTGESALPSATANPAARVCEVGIRAARRPTRLSLAPETAAS